MKFTTAMPLLLASAIPSARALFTTPHEICPDLVNLGPTMSGPSDPLVRPSEYPALSSPIQTPFLYDDNTSVFVGGTLTMTPGTLIEGKIVVMNNVFLEASPLPGSETFLGYTPTGSGAIPSQGSDGVLVGGSVFSSGSGPINVLSGIPRTSGSMVFGGSDYVEATTTINTGGNGQFRHDPSLANQQANTALLDEMKARSTYWNSLPTNGVATRRSLNINGVQEDHLHLSAATINPPCHQVFHLDAGALDGTNIAPHINFAVRFDGTLNFAAIIINVKADAYGTVNLANIASFIDPEGLADSAFNPRYYSSIIWNFPDATYYLQVAVDALTITLVVEFWPLVATGLLAFGRNGDWIFRAISCLLSLIRLLRHMERIPRHEKRVTTEEETLCDSSSPRQDDDCARQHQHAPGHDSQHESSLTDVTAETNIVQSH